MGANASATTATKRVNGPLPVADEIGDTTIYPRDSEDVRRHSRRNNAEAEKKRAERQKKKMDEKRSEEFGSSDLRRTISATENCSVMQKLFLVGDLIETVPRNQYTEEEKEETRKRMEMMASKMRNLNTGIRKGQSEVTSNPSKSEVEADTTVNPEEPVKPEPVKKKKLWDL